MKNNLLILDLLAKRYNKLPTEILDLPFSELQINFLCAEIGIKEENQIQQRALAKTKAKNYGKKI